MKAASPSTRSPIIGRGPVVRSATPKIECIASAVQDTDASDLDRAVLVRQLLRRWSLRDGRSVPIELAQVLADSVRKVAARVGLRCLPDGMWLADPWNPEWLGPNGVPDAAAAAGTEAGARFRSAPIAADPFFSSSTGFDNYRTPGQRAACRAVVTAPEGSTIDRKSVV